MNINITYPELSKKKATRAKLIRILRLPFIISAIACPIIKGWYTKSNVLSILNQYLERLRLHKAMYEEQPNAEILSQIRKDRVLVERWRKYLKANFQ